MAETKIVKIAKQYIESDLSCLPVKQDKSPDVSKWKDVLFKADNFENSKGIGVKCGKESGGLECFDFDNHFHDANKTLTKFIAEINDIYEKYKFPINKTQSGGYHLVYRCGIIEGNKKLASRPKWIEERKKFIPDAIIETRGEGGYFVAPPTKGYETVKNDFFNIPIISQEDREFIISVAKSFNEWHEIEKNEYENKDRPGDLYNADYTSIDESKTLLIANNWTDLGKGHWRRPGKTKGISATFGKVAENIFYCFTANGYPFEPEKSYTPFAVLTLLKFNKDFKEAAKFISDKYKPTEKRKEKVFEEVKKASKIEEMFKKSYIDTDSIVNRPPVILSFRDFDYHVKDKRVFTLGNFSVITGKQKSKKSFFLTMISGAMMRNASLYDKFIPNLPDDKRGILYFDTEQGYYDSYMAMKRIIKIANMDTSDHFAGFNLREYSPLERCDIIEHALKENPFVGFIVIDGIADLAKAVNDEEEATRVVGLLMRWTKQYNLHISTIIHQNKGNDFATGWLGSAVMKKCEVNIAIKKDETQNQYSHVECNDSRSIPFNDFSFEITTESIPVLADNIVNENDI